ncbi:hypothetical protein GJ744_009166 [Endocarpon pusillum]|uniref:Prion-inhibition and propagation HeLo domain-containing protein n=1 Tax=Endocarpon pusillum TaxID=364733 RepID=A0A8H7E523_9EURO|nr:hypothetical protein GJ744_009166 [Endocarpon pusillum]
MEVAGLVAGIPGLFSACMDILERIDAYKEFGLESRRAVARFEADKLRLRKWASDVGISEGKWEDMHDSRLKDHDLETVVKRILNSACEIFDATERTRSQLRIHPEETNKPFPSIPDSFIETKKNKGKASSQMSIRGGLGWAVKRRGKFNNQVDMFQGLVDTLYDLFPPQKASSPTDHVRGIQPYLELRPRLTFMRQMSRIKVEVGLQASRMIYRVYLKLYNVQHGNKHRQRSMTGLT